MNLSEEGYSLEMQPHRYLQRDTFSACCYIPTRELVQRRRVSLAITCEVKGINATGILSTISRGTNAIEQLNSEHNVLRARDTKHEND